MGTIATVLFFLFVAGAFWLALWGRDQGLSRSANSACLGGVCAGLARNFQVEPWLMRVIAVLLLLFTGGYALIVYVVLWGVLRAN